MKTDKYNKRALCRIEKLIENGERLNQKLSIIRLIVFLIGLTSTFVCFFYLSEYAAYFPIVLFSLTFLIITHFHNKLVQKIKQIKKYKDIHNEITARKIVDWDNITNYFIPDSKNNLERDLNLSGDKSLLHLINISRNKFSGEKLLNNLSSEKSFPEIQLNQKIVTELSNRSGLISKILLYGYDYKSEFYNDFEEWLLGADDKKNILSVLLLGTYLINLTLIVLSIFSLIDTYFIYSSILYIFVHYYYTIKTKSATKKTLIIIDEIKSFSLVFNFLSEIKIPTTYRLNEILKVFTDKKKSMKKIFKSLKNINSVLEMRGNPVIWIPVILIFPIDFILINKLNKHRINLKDIYPQSIESYHKLTAYISLAVFKINNKEYCIPTISESSERLIETNEIGHPLIQKNIKINNNYSITTENGIDIITGSNMSGKSTFLRTLGVNILLAYAGSVVNASHFNCSHFKLFTCINVSDSVVDGISYFYSEVKRLYELLVIRNEAEKDVFILIDEIFKGTNNKERLEGSQLFIKNIINSNIYGLISTHDLELAKLENDYPSIRNFHFKDTIVENKMIFDYRFLSGVCPTTNALKIIKNTMNI